MLASLPRRAGKEAGVGGATGGGAPEATEAVEFQAPGRVAVVPVPLPPAGAADVVLDTVYSGISAGTELLAYRGQLDPDWPLDERLGALAGTFRYPFRYGYSCVGVVRAGTRELPPGTAVFAFHPHQRTLVAPAAELIALAEGVDLRAATLFPLVETALQLALDAGPRLGEVAVVSGLGPVGLLTALLLARMGARVVAGEPRGWRRDLAGTLGVPAVAPERLPAAVAEATDGRGVPVLVELSGAPDALGAALGLLAHEGLVVAGSWYGTRPVPLPLGGAFHRRRLTLRSSQVSTVPAALAGRWDVGRRRAVASRLLTELPLGALATTEYPFGRAADAYAALDRAETGVMHVALRHR
jgi:2-desacetyl-2-hydroxyethyl bacteriochlorophyllide A dehydrogenase